MMPGELPASRYFPGSDPDDPDIEDLFLSGRTASPAEIRDELRRQMGEDVARAPRPPDHPDVHGIAEQLGLA